MGVDFALTGLTADTDAASPSTDLTGRLLKLESELGMLKRTVSEMRAELRMTRSEAV